MEATIDFKGIELDITFDYQPAEAAVNYYSDGSGYPGCPAEVTILDVSHKGECFSELLLDYIDELEELILEEMAYYE